MKQLKYKGTVYTVSAESSVLETLLENGQNIPNNCRAGACQTCLMQVTKGKVPSIAQKGLKDSYKAKNLFLSCACKPEEDMEICLPDIERLVVPATVTEISRLSNDVIELKLKPDKPLEYFSGQYVILWRDDTLGRNYSLASLPAIDENLIFHIQLIPGGQFTGWVSNDLKPGDRISVQEPIGDCFYTQGNTEQNIQLIGTGTGLAPLFGILRDAIQSAHKGEIHLFHGGLNSSGLYLDDILSQYSEQYDNFYYHPCVLKADAEMASNIIEGDLLEIVSQQIEKPAGWKSYLCGNPEMVKKLRKQIFLAGSRMNDIYSDPFVHT